MPTVNFKVTNNTTLNTSERVLVFLMPTNGPQSTDYNYAAWQILNPPVNGSQPFTFSQTIQLAVQDQATASQSPTIQVSPNQAYSVTDTGNQGPALTLLPTPPTDPSLVLVTNNTTSPSLMLASIWSIDGKPIVSEGGLNEGASQTFELFPTLFFMVATPTETGFNWKLQQFSAQTSYVVPTGTTSVEVSWSRPQGPTGPDVFTFSPPSAPSPTLATKAASARKPASASVR